jgi:hypothetical protein
MWNWHTRSDALTRKGLAIMDRSNPLDQPAGFYHAKALIYESELAFISRCVMDFPHIETGGDLFGFWTYSGYPVVQYVIGPGLGARRTEVAFYQDREYLITAGTTLRDTHGLQHIGEWHSHHRLSLAKPSQGDIRTVSEAMRNYKLSKFFLVICNIECINYATNTRINGFLFSPTSEREYDHCGWVILKGESPITQALNRAKLRVAYEPRAIRAPYAVDIATTLEAAVPLEPTEPQFPSESWVHTPEGQQRLRSITEQLSKYVVNLRIFQTADNRISLLFDLQDTMDSHKCEVIFPDDFPDSAPTVKLDGLLSRVKTDSVQWHNNNDACTSIIDTLNQHLPNNL